jgi:hypothetical protein
MSLHATKWAWMQSVSSTEKLVLLELSDHADKNNECFPSQKTIAKRTGFTPRAVNSALKKLETRQLIRRRRRMNRGVRTSDLITLLIDTPPAAPFAAAPPADSGPTPPLTSVSSVEPNSGGNQNDVPMATGTTFHVIYKDEPSRLNRNSSPFFIEFFEPGRPDLDELTYAARTICEISPALGPAIDWESPGIQNVRLVADWLKQLDEQMLTSCLTEVAQRNAKSGGAAIRSWTYFGGEVSRLLAQSDNVGSSTTSI